MSKREICKCPGCGRKVRVTFYGRLTEHRRRTKLTVAGWRECEWGGKPAPTETKREAES